MRASFLPPRRASQCASSQAAWEGSILGWGGVTGILGFLSHQPGPPSSPSSMHPSCQSSPQKSLPLLRKPCQMLLPAKGKSDPACEVAWSVPDSLVSHLAPPPPPRAPQLPLKSLLSVFQPSPCSYPVTFCSGHSHCECFLPVDILQILQGSAHVAGPAGTIGVIVHLGL